MRGIERVWGRLKIRAQDLSFDSQPVLFPAAITAILDIVRAQRADRPTAEGLEYLAEELMARANGNRLKKIV